MIKRTASTVHSSWVSEALAGAEFLMFGSLRDAEPFQTLKPSTLQALQPYSSPGSSDLAMNARSFRMLVLSSSQPAPCPDSSTRQAAPRQVDLDLRRLLVCVNGRSKSYI